MSAASDMKGEPLPQGMKALACLVVLCIFAQAAVARVVIHQVLYDPLGSESGGEAVELRNMGTEEADISGWLLVTQRSPRDAIVPEGTSLDPGARYLIADRGWSGEKDSPAWRQADLEEPITLNNHDSGVALVDANGAPVDAVGWGNASVLLEGMPAGPVMPGMVLLRIQDTDDNALDFIAANASFAAEQGAEDGFPVWLDVQEPRLAASIKEDDSPDPGTQLRPYAGRNRPVTVIAQGAQRAVFGNQSVMLTNGTGVLQIPYTTSPGTHTITVFSSNASASLEFTVLRRVSVRFEGVPPRLHGVPGTSAILKAAALLRNTGNVMQEVLIEHQGFAGSRSSIAAAALMLQLGDNPFLQLAVLPRVRLAPGETRYVSMRVDIPEDQPAGLYKGTLSLRTNDM